MFTDLNTFEAFNAAAAAAGLDTAETFLFMKNAESEAPAPAAVEFTKLANVLYKVAMKTGTDFDLVFGAAAPELHAFAVQVLEPMSAEVEKVRFQMVGLVAEMQKFGLLP